MKVDRMVGRKEVVNEGRKLQSLEGVDKIDGR